MNDNEEEREDAGFENALDSEAQTPTHQDGNGELPAPISNVAKRLARVPRQEQKEQAEKLWNFLSQDERDLSALNAEHLAVVLLVIVPDTMQLCVIHSMGYGTKTFLTFSPVAGKVLGLVGDGDADIDPDPVVLSPSVFKYMKMLVPTEAQVDVAIAAGKPVEARNVTTTADDLMQAVPVPAFVVYDGLGDGDLDPMELFPRLNLLDGLADWKVAAKNLAAAAMVKLRSTDPKAFVADLQQIPMHVLTHCRSNYTSSGLESQGRDGGDDFKAEMLRGICSTFGIKYTGKVVEAMQKEITNGLSVTEELSKVPNGSSKNNVKRAPAKDACPVYIKDAGTYDETFLKLVNVILHESTRDS
ncbi:predicted protein [Chaetoceros tenuissimus]|uniref:Uncharacterized protein n=1 Tax=Chaetoceros tenuissimus TaxID=426638 RepID=A0AAD3CNL7_9STRA|nr:predicted protein [Chaetoceros tenuissimus]